jgi:hypothetical protein
MAAPRPQTNLASIRRQHSRDVQRVAGSLCIGKRQAARLILLPFRLHRGAVTEPITEEHLFNNENLYGTSVTERFARSRPVAPKAHLKPHRGGLRSRRDYPPLHGDLARACPDAKIDDPPEGKVNGSSSVEHVTCELSRRVGIEETRIATQRLINADVDCGT